MTYLQNNWKDVRALYAKLTHRIMETPKNEWADDPYFWEGVVHMTPIENWFWADIRQCDAVLYPQYPVRNFFVDFANPKAKVAIECDGYAFHKDKAKDIARDRLLIGHGWSVHRISGSDCHKDSDPETGNPGASLKFIQRIASSHGILRGSQLHSMSEAA